MTVSSIVISSSTNTNPATEEAQRAHEQAMIDKVDAASKAASEAANPSTPSPTETPTEQRPDWLPEKFSSAEDLAKAYKELEQKLGSKENPESTPAPTEAPKENTPEINPETLQNDLQTKGLDFNKYQNEVISNGSLSEGSYKELADKGYPKDLVDGFISGQQAKADKLITESQSIVGGAEEYSKMIEWAGSALTKSEQEAFDRTVTEGNIDQIKLAVLGLHAKYIKENGSDPKLLHGETNTSSRDVFESNHQVTAAMKDPRYKIDPAYRAKVAEKIGRSNNVL